MTGSVIKTILLGGLAGFINGFFGTGGGIVLLLRALYGREEADRRDAFAGTLAVTVVLSAVSGVVYAVRGQLGTGIPFRYCLPALAGGALGARLLDRCPSAWLSRLFAVFVTVAGAVMLFR